MKGFIVAGTGSGVGKTSITTGIMAILSKKYKVQGFKVGPDYIDPMYHSVATGRPSRNLDSFMLSDDQIKKIVASASKDSDIFVIEGVRGLFEGMYGDSDLGSTAYIAKLLNVPVVLVLDTTSLTRSAAAIVKGFKSFDPDIKIAGVILNKVSGKQHSDKLDISFSTYCKDIDVIGKIPKDKVNSIPQRHLGLTTIKNKDRTGINYLEKLVENLDYEKLDAISENINFDIENTSPYVERKENASIAVPYDDAYCFYYEDNLECLRKSGFKIKKFSPIDGESLPSADAIYLGGGYPELYLSELSSNKDFLDGIKNMHLENKPILGECGGLMSLCSNIVDQKGIKYSMAGVFDCDSVFVNKRHGPTYVVAEPTKDNPLFYETVKAHEYHYSEVELSLNSSLCFNLLRGEGIKDRKDGLYSKNSLGTYMHQHALSSNDWAKGFVEKLQ